MILEWANDYITTYDYIICEPYHEIKFLSWHHMLGVLPIMLELCLMLSHVYYAQN